MVDCRRLNGGSLAQRWLLTPTWAHIDSSGHDEHLGALPVQICLPKGTSSALISIQWALGKIASRAVRVFSGVAAAT